MKTKLLSFTVNPKDVTKVDFTVARRHREPIVVTLKEQPSWPVIWGQPLDDVETWLFDTYLLTINFAFGGALL